MLPVKLFQIDDGRELIGDRMSFMRAQLTKQASQDDVDDYRNMLEGTEINALNVLSFHPGVSNNQSKIKALSADRTIVAHGGVPADADRLVTYLAQNGGMILQDKLSLSSEDEEGEIVAGDTLHIFKASRNVLLGAVNWAVLNCHDYTHVELVEILLEHDVEILVVVAYNPATRLYREYAISDAHRLFAYIVSVNTANIGGSGVYAPFRRLGKNKNASFGAGAELFGTRGPGAFETRIDLDIGRLRNLKEDFSENGFNASTFGTDEEDYYNAVAPSEKYLDTGSNDPNFRADITLRDIETSRLPDSLKVAIVQMQPMSRKAYLENKYRFPRGRERASFCREIATEMEALLARSRSRNGAATDSEIDLVVLPEVFAPRDFAAGYLSDFAHRSGATIVAGLDYPGLEESENANECVIIRPDGADVMYRKITRSQYDAVGADMKSRMMMQRGTELIRFIDKAGVGFGVLICYDYSHLNIMRRINLEGRDHPLDFVIVVANNPFAQLYRACCIADAHRFYQYIVMCNVSEYGGSGMFAPASGSGARQTLGELGKGSVGTIYQTLDLKKLRENRSRSDVVINNRAEKHKGGERFMRRPGIFQFRIDDVEVQS